MCGRTACTLGRDEVIRSCGYMSAAGQWVYPRWQDPPSGQTYYPSYNLAPSKHSPILFSKASVQSESTNPMDKECSGDDSAWMVQPMHWGLIPSWHHGEPKEFGYKMNNARSDGLLLKASFKKPLEMGRRCVVLADGYFEWHTSKDGKKQPYFIYFPPEESKQPKEDSAVKTEPIDTVCEDPDKVEAEIGADGASNAQNLKTKQEPDADASTDAKVNILEKKDEKGADRKSDPVEITDSAELQKSSPASDASHGKRLLTMAGLYDIWKGKDGEILYSYSIITVDAHPDLEFIHERMPAILNGNEEVQRWLDYKSYPLDKALQLLRPTNCLKYHPVSSAYVNDSRNHAPECIQEIDLKSAPPKKISASGNFMQAWLKSGGAGEVKRKSEDEVEGAEKKMKLVYRTVACKGVDPLKLDD